jgi:Cof subfamily protein (haloacid dehalogenase superfamily)
MEIKLIVVDLDWSALNSKKQLTPRTHAAFAAALGAGRLVVPATGRHINFLPLMLLETHAFPFVITDNGTQVVCLPQRGVIYSCAFVHEIALELLRVLRGFRVMIQASLGGINLIDPNGGVERSEKLLNIYRRFTSVWNIPTGDVMEALLGGGSAINKLALVFSDLEEKQRCITLFSSWNGLCMTSSEDHDLELMPVGTSKGAALRFLAGQLGIGMEQVMAIGDNSNDLEMIEAVGYGVAMGNAIPQLKQKADYITLPCDEDGVAVVIEKLLEGLL